MNIVEGFSLSDVFGRRKVTIEVIDRKKVLELLHQAARAPKNRIHDEAKRQLVSEVLEMPLEPPMYPVTMINVYQPYIAVNISSEKDLRPALRINWFLITVT